ncbi:MAG: FadR/GntR family transcriptional regulator [Bacillota bacterium]
MEVKKISRKRIYEDVSEQLEEMLLKGGFKPGEKLHSEKKLAEMFGVSRTTIRQALTVLETKGLIERRQGSATYRTQVDEVLPKPLMAEDHGFSITDLVIAASSAPKDILSEPLEARRIIEPSLAKLAAKRADESDLAIIEKCLQVQGEAVKEGKNTTDEDSQFHFSIARASKNSMMQKLVETLHKMLYNSRYRSHLAEGEEKAYREHQKIFEAIKSRKPEEAYDLMLQHLLGVEKNILIHVKEKEQT